MRSFATAVLITAALNLGALGCAGGSSGGAGLSNDAGSQPLNDSEAIEYKKALTRCYKTGGTRIVKINNYLHCY